MTDDNVFTLSKLRPYRDSRSEKEKIEEALRKQNQHGDLELAAQHLEDIEQGPLLHSEVPNLRDAIMDSVMKKMRDAGLPVDHPNMWAISGMLDEMLDVALNQRDEQIAADLMMVDDVFCPREFDPVDYRDVVEFSDPNIVPEGGWVDIVERDE